MYSKWKQAESTRVIVDDNGLMVCLVSGELPIYDSDTQRRIDLIIAAPDMREGLKDALREICRMCVRLNPQHENCTSCEEMERSRRPLLKAEGK